MPMHHGICGTVTMGDTSIGIVRWEADVQLAPDARPSRIRNQFVTVAYGTDMMPWESKSSLSSGVVARSRRRIAGRWIDVKTYRVPGH